MRAVILAIGDEIVKGQITDTNSGFLADLLLTRGVETLWIAAVPDDPEAIVAALQRALDAAELVVTTGGLGPTTDDLSAQAIAAVAGVPLELHAPSLSRIVDRFRARGIEMPPNNRKQAMVPRGCEVLENERGTAPGFITRVEHAAGRRVIVTLPGVPSEMRWMATERMLPRITKGRSREHFASRVFSVVGLTESGLGQLMEGVISPEEARVAYRASFPKMQLRLTVRGSERAPLDERLDEFEQRVRQRIGEYIYAIGDIGLEEVVAEMLLQQELSIGVAESCTGGLIGHRLTEVPGSSAFFNGAVVAYANSAKSAILGVPPATLSEHGAVSRETAEAMAVGAKDKFEAAIGLSTTGIAGPTGGTADKPVGTVCVAIAAEGALWSRRFDLGDRGRGIIKSVTAQLALDALRRHLLGRLDEA